MKYCIIDGAVKLYEKDCCCSDIIEIVPYIEGEIPKAENETKQKILDLLFTRTYTRFESYDNCDVMCLNLLHIEKHGDKSVPVYCILEKDKLAFYTTEPEYVDSLCRKIAHENIKGITTGDFLYYFMHKLIHGDLVHLEEIETKLSALETNAFSGCTDKTFAKKILNIKKHLMWIELHYEQLISTTDDLTENQNDLLGGTAIKKLNTFNGQLDRLISKTRNLIEYASEIRSAYQAEVDLQINKSMKILTVISVIVLPLSLLAGWYGMNLQMPEYSYALSYPILIIVSAFIIIAGIIYFKKNKWF